MKDLVIVYLVPIRIVMSFIYPRNRFAPGKLTSTFFGVYIPNTSSVAMSSCVWGSTCCALCTIKGRKISGFSLLYTLSHQVLWYQIIKCLRLTCGELQHIMHKFIFLHVHTTSMCDVLISICNHGRYFR